MTAIAPRRWHWLLFVLLCLTNSLGWWITLKKAPDGASVLHFLHSLGWMMRILLVISVAAGPAFLLTVTLAKLLKVFGDNQGSSSW
jgi:hypothetical protein